MCTVTTIPPSLSLKYLNMVVLVRCPGLFATWFVVKFTESPCEPQWLRCAAHVIGWLVSLAATNSNIHSSKIIWGLKRTCKLPLKFLLKFDNFSKIYFMCENVTNVLIQHNMSEWSKQSDRAHKSELSCGWWELKGSCCIPVKEPEVTMATRETMFS